MLGVDDAALRSLSGKGLVSDLANSSASSAEGAKPAVVTLSLCIRSVEAFSGTVEMVDGICCMVYLSGIDDVVLTKGSLRLRSVDS